MSFDEALEKINQELIEMSASKLSKRINTLLSKMSVPTFDREELEDAIDNLSDNAKEALEDGLKAEDTVKINSILGMKEISRFDKK